LKCAAFDGKLVVGGTSNGSLHVWNMGGQSMFHAPKAHNGEITSVFVAADGSKVATGSEDCTVRVWNKV
jgi:WD40 repeat protein